MKDQTLIDVFITQAASALAGMQDPACTESTRIREVADLRGAAQLLGNADIEAGIESIVEDWSKGAISCAEDLATMVSELRPPQAPVVRPAAQFDGKSRAPEAPVKDSTKTQVQAKPRRRSSKFDTGEHLTLLNFFREEASEGLDQITEMLLTSTASKPSDMVFNELMRLTHALKGAAGTVDLPTVAELSHQYEGVVERIRLNLLEWTIDLRDELVEVAGQLRIVIADAVDPAATRVGAQRLKQRLAELDKDDAERDSSAKSELLVTEAKTATSFPERRRPDRRSADSPMLRVDPIRIDRLMNSASELVFDRTRIEKRVSELAREIQSLSEALIELSNQRGEWVEKAAPVRADQLSAALNKLESDLSERLPHISSAMTRLKKDTELLRRTEFALQDGLTGVRMQSVHSLFQRLTPQLRAIARQANKKVRLVTAGGDTEFDKTVADQMVDPIIQLLRNAMAHGIESPSTRESRGKSPVGCITVTARHEGNVVVLEVGDDGGGIDTVALRARAIENKRWTASQAELASDQRVLQLIFDSGFTSRKDADQLAGRGVGLSVVQQTVTRLGGEVQVSSVARRGTTFTLRLPLTTAIVDAMLFKVGGHVFALPNVHVIETSRTPLPLAISLVRQGGHNIPLVNLHNLLHHTLPENATATPILVLEYLGKRLAIPCDKIVGPREIVVNSLGPLLAGVGLYAGATISPSGKVQLILDTPVLVGVAYPETLEREARGSDAIPKGAGVSQRVLIVDDSKATREAMRRMLEPAGYEVIIAHDGKSAWNRINEQGCDLLVTDLEMPGEGGFALLEKLRSDPRYQDMPALVISSKDTAENRKRADSLSVISFITKPVTQEALIDALRATGREL